MQRILTPTSRPLFLSQPQTGETDGQGNPNTAGTIMKLPALSSLSPSTLLAALPPSLPLLLLHTLLTLPFLLLCMAGLLSLRPSHARRNLGLSCLYVGRVWHVRFLPTIHKFGYGLFYTYLDLGKEKGR